MLLTAHVHMPAAPQEVTGHNFVLCSGSVRPRPAAAHPLCGCISGDDNIHMLLTAHAHMPAAPHQVMLFAMRV